MSTKTVPHSDQQAIIDEVLGNGRLEEIVAEKLDELDKSEDIIALRRAFKLETAHAQRSSIQAMLLTEVNQQFKADAELPLPDRLPTIHGMTIDLQRRAIAYNELVDNTIFKTDSFDQDIQAHATDVAVSAIQLIDILGKPAVEEFMNKLEVSNKDIHLRIPKVAVHDYRKKP